MLGSSRYNIAQEPPAPPQENSTYEAKVVFRGINNQYYWYFGNYVAPPSINNSEDNTYYAIAWRQSSGTSTYFVDNKLNSVNIKQLNIPGKYLQVSNGPTKDNMYIDIFNNQTEPYYFKTSNNLGSYYGLNKVTDYTFLSGREGIVGHDSTQFTFSVGDISVDNQTVKFVEMPDSIVFNSKEILNQYLKTEEFELTDNSSFLYSVEYGITDSIAVVNLLKNTNKYVSFKLQLIDAQSNEILGDYDAFTYNQSNICKYNNFSYQVNTEGIGNRTVYLRLVEEDNFNPGYSLANIYAIGNTLEKAALKTRNYNGQETVKSYELSQNYPNPFNPTTKITYQVPKPGNVEMKVYDILGREVMTLVDGFKNVGKYTVDFNASKLASGVYIYRLKAGDFISTKKMVLLK